MIGDTVPYPTFSGSKRESYEVEKKDPIEKVKFLVDSWKNTSLFHGFNSRAISSLSCKALENGYELTFAAHKDPESELYLKKCKIDKMDAEVDLDKASEDASVTLTINGKNLSNNRDFKILY